MIQKPCLNTLNPLPKTQGSNFEAGMPLDKLPNNEVMMTTSDKDACYGIYFKGILSRGPNKVPRIGMAISDKRKGEDKPIVKKVRAVKNVELGGDYMIRVIGLDTLALIEGLEAALDLGLKKVTIMCDDFFRHQYVRGSQQPEHKSMELLVNQVGVYFRKSYHIAAYISSFGFNNKYQHALELAIIRDAMMPVMTLPPAEEASSAHQELNRVELNIQKETCRLCFKDTDVSEMFSIDVCLNRYCLFCIKHHVEEKFRNGGLMANCPNEGCNSEEKITNCRKFLAPELYDAVVERQKEAEIPVSDRIYCPNPKCSALMPKRYLKYKYNIDLSRWSSKARECKKCHQVFRIKCKPPWNSHKSCNSCKRSNPDPCGVKMISSLAQEKGWRQCARSNHMIGLSVGCPRITCRCGYKFCYDCGGERTGRKGKRTTCARQPRFQNNFLYNLWGRLS